MWTWSFAGGKWAKVVVDVAKHIGLGNGGGLGIEKGKDVWEECGGDDFGWEDGGEEWDLL